MKAKANGVSFYYGTNALWVNPLDNPRVIGVVARAGAKWKRPYARRQGIERMFGPLKRSMLLNQHLYVRRDKGDLHIGMSVASYLATMLTRPRPGHQAAPGPAAIEELEVGRGANCLPRRSIRSRPQQNRVQAEIQLL